MCEDYDQSQDYSEGQDNVQGWDYGEGQGDYQGLGFRIELRRGFGLGLTAYSKIMTLWWRIALYCEELIIVKNSLL